MHWLNHSRKHVPYKLTSEPDRRLVLLHDFIVTKLL
jgi:hypothetical protein